ncbi:hypothetical protein KT99_18677 [Shewanella benthica KT99]|uniref:Uncharacterized protein n=1 Tax=Shewanella benthica KT99 TaxID=314608 RepID=A9CWU3_9GAMM|nr:hypothetical protein KT99_18677 [Shewanella benthica KT99]
MLRGRNTENFIWLGEPIELELKVCWNMQHRHSKLQKWFRKLNSSIIIEQLTDKDAIK